MAKGLPARARQVARDYGTVWTAHQALGKACAAAGPLKGESKRLVKLALAIGSGSQGAVHSHARQAMAEGISAEAIRQVALLAIPTVGFPHGVAALSWIDDVLTGGAKPAARPARRSSGR